jgi:hypothetical protein
MREVIYTCCDSTHVGPPNETETCFFCGSIVKGEEIPVYMLPVTADEVDPDEVSLYQPGAMDHLRYEWDIVDIPA